MTFCILLHCKGQQWWRTSVIDTCGEGRRWQAGRQALGTADLLGFTDLLLQHQQRRLVTQLSSVGIGSTALQQENQ